MGRGWMMICSGNGNTKTDHGEILELSFSLIRTHITMAQLEFLAKYLENSTCEGEYKLQQFRQGRGGPMPVVTPITHLGPNTSSKPTLGRPNVTRNRLPTYRLQGCRQALTSSQPRLCRNRKTDTTSQPETVTEHRQPTWWNTFVVVWEASQGNNGNGEIPGEYT